MSNYSYSNNLTGDTDDDDGDCWKDAVDNLPLDSEIGLDQSKIYISSNNSNNNKHSNITDETNHGLQLNDINSNHDINKTESVCDNLQLHRAIFENDSEKLNQLFKNHTIIRQLVTKKDKHGNTPLHLACMLGRPQKIVQDLIEHGALLNSKNINGWSPFHEACSYGNREIITLMTSYFRKNICDTINKTRLSEQLIRTKNYKLVLKWEFRTWVPFFSRVLPSDVCIITKHGANIRIDTSLHELGPEMLSWKRADGCLIYSPNFERKWVILNNKTKRFHFLETKNRLGKQIEYQVDDLMSNDIISFDLKSSDIRMTRSTYGLFWKAEKYQKIGKFNAALYEFDNVFLLTRKRREHLSEEDLKKNKIAQKSAMDMLKFGKNMDEHEEESDPEDGMISDDEEPETHRESLPPPPKPRTTWSQYCAFPPGENPPLGRGLSIKVTKKAFKASIAMSEEFPISKNEFIDLISIIPLKHFGKLKEFIEMKLPDGFPVRVDVPILPFLTARITFEDFEFIDGSVDESMFTIPDDYVEDPEMLSMFTKQT